MDQKELLKNLYQFVIDNLSYEEYHNFGSPDNFHKWAEMHYKIIPKSELIINKKYNGNCRNASEAVWNGEKFIFSEKGKVMQTTYDKYNATEKEIIDWFGLNNSDIDWFKIEIDNE